MATSLIHFAPPGNSVKIPPLSAAVRAGNLLFVSGTPGYDDAYQLEETFQGQFNRAFLNLSRILIESGASLKNILKVNALLTRADDVAEFNRLYAESFAPAPYPARTTSIVLALPDPAMLLEIECIAFIE